MYEKAQDGDFCFWELAIKLLGYRANVPAVGIIAILSLFLLHKLHRSANIVHQPQEENTLA
jgi:hypothetical protein